MSSKTKLTCVAVGLLLSANADAVVLGTDAPRAYAAELVDGTVLIDAGDAASFTAGYNFSEGEVRYGRFECTDNLVMASATMSTTSVDLSLGTLNGQGSNALFFSMTAGAAPGLTADDVIEVHATNILVRGGTVDCAFSIYDYPSQAHAGGVTGRVYTSGWQPFISRPSGFVFAPTHGRPSEAVADVEAPGGAYFDFTSAGPEFANLAFEAVTGVLLADGAQVTLADIFDPATAFTIEGDFSAATQVWLYNLNDASWYTPEALVPERASFVGYTFDIDADLQFQPTTTQAIPESRYTATLYPVPNPGFQVSQVGPLKIGAIVHNGAELQVPLAQVPGGWTSRIMLTNTGGIERPYVISLLGEDGNVIGVDSTLMTGWIPASGSRVVELNEVLLTFSGKRRATLIVSVAGPDDQIQGQYQIVGPDGALSNLIMVRAGTN